MTPALTSLIWLSVRRARTPALLVVAAVLLCVWQPVAAQGTLELDLAGEWQFRPGDDLDWSLPSSQSGRWAAIGVPGAWEEQGYAGYDGFAWYRKVFKLDPRLSGKVLYLVLGRVDDVDEVYLNGWLVGSRGTMPPAAKTAYHEERAYRLPSELVRFGDENVVAVRVYDMYLEGGIVSGPAGIYSRSGEAPWTVDLTGSWKFSAGDDLSWREPAFDDSEWSTVSVPANWEPQGFRHYDGYAWYRKRFYVPDEAVGQEFVLRLGKIDDLDATYLNGVEIGRTGDIDRGRVAGDEWQRIRRYPVPEQLLKVGGYNTVAVRVYDGLVVGGIFEGEVGLYPAHTPMEPPGKLEKLLRALFGDH